MLFSKLIATGALIAAAASPLSALAIGLPFGGAITGTVITCNDKSLYFKISAPTPMFLIYKPGLSFSYLFGPPIHDGQWLLGVAGVPSICTVGHTAYPPAPTIDFHGSSL